MDKTPLLDLPAPVSNPFDDEWHKSRNIKNKKAKRRARFFKALGLAGVCFWLGKKYVHDGVPEWMMMLGEDDAPWRLPSDVSLANCAAWSSVGETAFDDEGEYPFSANASFTLPVSAETLFLLSRHDPHQRALLAMGHVRFVQSEEAGEEVQVAVTAHFAHQKYLDGAKACVLKQGGEESGVGLFTEYDRHHGHGHRRHPHRHRDDEDEDDEDDDEDEDDDDDEGPDDDREPEDGPDHGHGSEDHEDEDDDEGPEDEEYDPDHEDEGNDSVWPDHHEHGNKLRFDITVTLPAPSNKSDGPLVINKLATDLQLFTQVFGDMRGVAFRHLALKGSLGGIFAESLVAKTASIRTSLGPVHIESLTAARADVHTSLGAIEGTFNASRSLVLRTSNAPIRVAVNLSNESGDEKARPSELWISTSNGAINATLALHSAHNSSAFDIAARTSRGALTIAIPTAPPAAAIFLDASTSIGAAAVALPAGYEGNFDAATSLSAVTVNLREGAEDPTGEGRERKVEWKVNSSRLVRGKVGWSAEGMERGWVGVRTSLAPVTLDI